MWERYGMAVALAVLVVACGPTGSPCPELTGTNAVEPVECEMANMDPALSRDDAQTVSQIAEYIQWIRRDREWRQDTVMEVAIEIQDELKQRTGQHVDFVRILSEMHDYSSVSTTSDRSMVVSVVTDYLEFRLRD